MDFKDNILQLAERIEYIISQRRYYGHDEGVFGGFLCLDGIFLLLYPFCKLKYISLKSIPIL